MKAKMRNEVQQAMKQAIKTSRYSPLEMLKRIDRELSRLAQKAKEAKRNGRQMLTANE